MERRLSLMEDSLRRSSELSREVLQRARRRGCWSPAPEEHPNTTQEDEGSRISLQEAFTVMSQLMRHSTRHCQAYHSSLPPRRMSDREKQHISRYHQQTAERPASHRSSHSRPSRQDPRDVYIEVSPGTYRVSAGSPEGRPQTHIVNIAAGQSVDLTFSL